MPEIFPGVVLVVIFVVCVIAGLIADNSSSSKPKTPEELDQEAAWYRAQKRNLEAKQECELAQAHLEDVRDFIKKRNGNGRHHA